MFKDAKVKAELKAGVVHLTGEVANNEAKKKAGELAEGAIKAVSGTEKVNNALKAKAH